MFSYYTDWSTARLKGLKKYISPEYFKSKTLLEVGCGYADIGNEFHKLGAKVTSSDGRKEYLDIVKKKYPHITTLLIDNEKDSIKDKYNIIVHWSLLCHLEEINTHLANISQKCDILLLETEVSDSNDKHFYISTYENGSDQALHKKGIRPSQNYIETILELNGFKFTLIKDPVLNSGCHRYDWEISNSNTWRHGLRRFWICWKNIESPIIYSDDHFSNMTPSI